MKKLVVLIVSLFVLIIFTGCHYDYTYDNIQPVICDKHFESSYISTEYDILTESFKSVYNSERYIVTVKHNDEEFCIDNKMIYDNYKIGDKINAYLEHTYRNGKLIRNDVVFNKN
jgi:hypothetical protein